MIKTAKAANDLKNQEQQALAAVLTEVLDSSKQRGTGCGAAARRAGSRGTARGTGGSGAA